MRANHISKIYTPTAVLLVVVICFISCKKASTDPANLMAFDDVVYVTEFPETFTLRDKEVPDLDIIGLRSFAIYDSLMILNTTNKNGLWSLYSLPDYRYFGSYLKRGEGPLEFMQGPSASSKISLISTEDQMLAYLYDFQKGRVLKFDIGESIRSKELHLSVLNDNLPPFLFDFVMIDSSMFFVRELDGLHTQQIRQLRKNGEKHSLPVLEKLNQASISQGEDVNILSAITKFSGRHHRFVEMPIGLNYINLYALDSPFAKTICIGERLFDISDIQREYQWNRIYTFADVRIFDEFFGVVYINESKKKYQSNRTRLPSILLFDYEGAPLAELKLENHITSFDIDFVNDALYTFDVHSDEFFRYDIHDILRKLKI